MTMAFRISLLTLTALLMITLLASLSRAAAPAARLAVEIGETG